VRHRWQAEHLQLLDVPSFTNFWPCMVCCSALDRSGCRSISSSGPVILSGTKPGPPGCDGNPAEVMLSGCTSYTSVHAVDLAVALDK